MGGLAEVDNRQQAEKIISGTPKADIDITITPHSNQNSSERVIFDPDRIKDTDDDLLQGLKD